MVALKSIKGEKHGRWTILKDEGGGKCFCKCDCGVEKVVSKYNILSGSSKGCGCVKSKPGNVGLYLCWKAYEIRARKKEIEFSLTKEEFKEITSKSCFYCNKPPSQIHKNHYKSKIKSRRDAASKNTEYVHNGIDRVDSNKGYTVKNSVPCCKDCNFSKRKMTQDEFRFLIINIYHNWAKL